MITERSVCVCFCFVHGRVCWNRRKWARTSEWKSKKWIVGDGGARFCEICMQLNKIVRCIIKITEFAITPSHSLYKLACVALSCWIDCVRATVKPTKLKQICCCFSLLCRYLAGFFFLVFFIRNLDFVLAFFQYKHFQTAFVPHSSLVRNVPFNVELLAGRLNVNIVCKCAFCCIIYFRCRFCTCAPCHTHTHRHSHSPNANKVSNQFSTPYKISYAHRMALSHSLCVSVVWVLVVYVLLFLFSLVVRF